MKLTKKKKAFLTTPSTKTSSVLLVEMHWSLHERTRRDTLRGEDRKYKKGIRAREEERDSFLTPPIQGSPVNLVETL